MGEGNVGHQENGHRVIVKSWPTQHRPIGSIRVIVRKNKDEGQRVSRATQVILSSGHYVPRSLHPWVITAPKEALTAADCRSEQNQ